MVVPEQSVPRVVKTHVSQSPLKVCSWCTLHRVLWMKLGSCSFTRWSRQSGRTESQVELGGDNESAVNVYRSPVNFSTFANTLLWGSVLIDYIKVHIETMLRHSLLWYYNITMLWNQPIPWWNVNVLKFTDFRMAISTVHGYLKDLHILLHIQVQDRWSHSEWCICSQGRQRYHL